MKSDQPFHLNIRNVDLNKGILLSGEVRNLEDQDLEKLKALLQSCGGLELESLREEDLPEILVLQPGEQTVRIRVDHQGFSVNYPDDLQAGVQQYPNPETVCEVLFGSSEENVSFEDSSEESHTPETSARKDSLKWGILVAGIVVLVAVWAGNIQPAPKVEIVLPEYQKITDSVRIEELKSQWQGTYLSQPENAFIIVLKPTQKAYWYTQLPGATPVEDPPLYDYHFGKTQDQTVIVVPQLGIFIPNSEGRLLFENQAFLKKEDPASS